MEAMTGVVEAPGASLHYRVQGRGPVLLILQGGDGNADHSARLVEYLLDSYTVVTYDRRGLSRSPMQDPNESVGLTTHGDDALRVLAAVTPDNPAMVVGFSIGALIGLELIAHRPDRISALLAHEPPVLRLLSGDDRNHAIRVHEDVIETYRRDGMSAAVPKMMAMVGLNVAKQQPESPAPTTTQRDLSNLGFFLANDLPAVLRYEPDVPSLKQRSGQIMLAAGLTSTDVAAHQCAYALAQELGTPVAEFPGGHAGAVTDSMAFAARLREVMNHRANQAGA